jgi:hypothetical protein
MHRFALVGIIGSARMAIRREIEHGRGAVKESGAQVS